VTLGDGDGLGDAVGTEVGFLFVGNAEGDGEGCGDAVGGPGGLDGV